MSIDPISTQPPAATAPQHHHRHGHGHGKQVVDAAATALGMDPADLTKDLQGGQSLDDIAKAQGLSHDQLAAAVQSQLQKSQQPAAGRPPLGAMVDVDA
jgi:hypothetical protein